VEKCGQSQDKLKADFRDLMRRCCTLMPASKVGTGAGTGAGRALAAALGVRGPASTPGALRPPTLPPARLPYQPACLSPRPRQVLGYVKEGLESKNNRTRVACAEEIASIVDREGARVGWWWLAGVVGLGLWVALGAGAGAGAPRLTRDGCQDKMRPAPG
jgi:hypothetical protein